MRLSRREMLGAVGAVAATARFWVAESHAQNGPAAGKYAALSQTLDKYAEQFMRDKNAPGMTLVMVDRDGVQRVATYGLGDLEGKRAVGADELFQIGSITKSFIGLVLLQLHDEGKLDFHKPVVEYLPWFKVQSSFAPITTHHLLTHTSGMPGASDVFLSDPTLKHIAAYPPGQHFNYNNMAYSLLGHLAWTLDGRELPELFRERIFKPLGMLKSEPTINYDTRGRLVKSYSSFQSDRPYVRYGRLCEAPAFILTTAAGCISSTARDMGAYLQMIANGGRGPKGALVSPASFKLFSQAHIPAADFGATAGYGYGVAVDKFDGHASVLHTGGMVSFMSSMHVDLEEGVGVFASINAQQGYRPTPVVRYAVQLMRAQRSGKALPELPARDVASEVENAADYVGSFASAKGKLEIASEGTKLYVARAGKRIALEKAGDADRFVALDAELGRFPLLFGRKANGGPVVEVTWGGEWYTSAAYDGPRQFNVPKEWHSYVGHYHNSNPWVGSSRVVIVKDQLMLDGHTPLQADGDLFRLRDTPYNTEYIRFGQIVNGKCMHLKFSGEDLWRVMTA